MTAGGNIIDCAEKASIAFFKAIDDTALINQAKVLRAFQAEEVAPRHFSSTTGYGYDDIGRDTLERVFARVFGCEDALVRPSIASGTHALALCLYGLLRPGDVLLAAAGKPYDTLSSIIGDGAASGSLADFGVGYEQVELLEDGGLDIAKIAEAVSKREVRVVLVQRSRGYAWRPSLTNEAIGEVVKVIKASNPRAVVMVDNCYGEFTQAIEPTNVGADIMAGSLIKNPGGGLAPSGGYIAGKSEYIELIAARLSAPGIGREVGSYAASYAPFYQGLFLAPHITAQALKTATLAAHVFSMAGFDVLPRPEETVRNDIIQAIKLGKAELLRAFCHGIQKASPIDAHVMPEPWEMPGYDSDVIMAAGTFVQGASIELSADSLMQHPYVAYMQGGLTYEHGRIGIESALNEVLAIS